MKLTDEQLRERLHKLDAAILASLPDPKDCKHEFSPEFERKMEQLFLLAKEAAAELVPEGECDPTIPPELTPSFHGRDCLGNGTWPGYECYCDECEHYLACFPESI